MINKPYSPIFAKVYNKKFTGFISYYGRKLTNLISEKGYEKGHVLDLGCGTGHFVFLLSKIGFKTTGLDNSKPMLEIAKENNLRYIKTGFVKLIHGDATNFSLKTKADIITSTFNVLNHLSNFQALELSFKTIFNSLNQGGLFIFDLNTKRGLSLLNNISITESDDIILIERGSFDGQERAWTRFTGFIKNNSDTYDRFEEHHFSTFFSFEKVKLGLENTGFVNINFLNPDSFKEIKNPEEFRFIFITAEKPTKS